MNEAHSIADAGVIRKVVLIAGAFAMTTVVLGLASCVIVCDSRDPAARSVAWFGVEKFSTALREYKQDTGSFPDDNEGLKVWTSAPAHTVNWRGPYLPSEAGEIRRDPWGRSYIYQFDSGIAGIPKIGTYGADGKPGGQGRDEDIFVFVDVTLDAL